MSAEPRLDIVHEDPDFVVVDKASGLLSVPGIGPAKRDCVTRRVELRYPGCLANPAVHRLDMDTSGLMVVPRTAAAQSHLARQFQRRSTKKRYVALLAGALAEAAGTIRLAQRLDVENRPRQICDDVHGKVGITHFERLGFEGDRTRVVFTPVTGRTHQLRVHAAHARGLGIPIVGDLLYGNGACEGRLRLHATELGFEHPRTGEPLRFASEAPF